jgi:hypothetical protein
LFSPADEPAHEVMLAAPRPLAWLLIERWAVMVALQVMVGLVFTGIVMAITGETDLAIMLSQWLAPAILLSGIGMAITLISRQALFGVLMTMLIWFAMLLVGDGLVARWPFAWPLHPYLRPETFGATIFWLNRAFLTLAGAGLMVLAVRQLRDAERVLGIKRGRNWRKNR